MTHPVGSGTIENVPAPGSGARQWIAAGVLLLVTFIGRPSNAGAATMSYEVSDQSVVQIIGRSATITVRTWARNMVEIDWPDGESIVSSKASHETRASFMIPTVSVEERLTPERSVMATLLPEDFPVPKLQPGLHDVVRVAQTERPGDLGRPGPPVELSVMIPESTGLVNVRSARGDVTLSGYHGTTIAVVGRGRVVFDNVSGDAFVQPLNGHFYATASTFDRLRIRSNRADEIFDACRVKQIEATTLSGNIVFDNGVFDPGLARFESDRGSIALGVNGSAQLGAHSGDGHVLSVLPPPSAPPLLGRSGTESVMLAGSGGPLVNASSTHGDVLLYDGSLADRRPTTLDATWHPMYNLLLSSRDVTRRKTDVHVMPQPQPHHVEQRAQRWHRPPRRPNSQ